MASWSACVIGSTQLAVDCCQVALESGISVTHVFTDDFLLKAWANRFCIVTEGTEQFCQHPTKFFSCFDLLLSIVNDVIVPTQILKAVNLAPINYHNGPLPKYAGANATHWALINGESKHGVTWHIMYEKVDCGLVLSQQLFQIKEEEDVINVSLHCREAALTSFKRLCKELSVQSPHGIPQMLDKKTKHCISSQPSAFCMLPFQLGASKVKDHTRAMCTFGRIPLQNAMGLPKVFLPPYSKPAIVLRLTVLKTKADAVPGTCIDVIDEGIIVSTADKNILITEMVMVDGSSFPPPFKNSLPSLKTHCLHLDSAHKKKSLLSQAGRHAAKYEKTWIKEQSQKIFPAPLLWPFQTCLVSDSDEISGSLQYSEIPLANLDISTIYKLKVIIPQYEAEIIVLAALLVFLLAVSPTSAGTVDVYCNDVPEPHYGLLLQALPLSLDLNRGDCCYFKRTVTKFTKLLKTLVFGEIENGHRKNIVASDVYLRYPGLLSSPKNTLAVKAGENNVTFSCRHDIVICSQDCKGNVVSVKAFVKKSVHHKYSFSRFKESFFLFLNSSFDEPDRKVTSLPLCDIGSLKEVKKALTGCQASVHNELVHEPIEQQAQMFPYVTAVIDEFGSHTYHDVMDYAYRIAYALVLAFGTKNGLRVALLLERTWEAIASMLGVLIARGCFVLLEGNQQSEVLCRYIQTTDCHAVLVSSTRSNTSELFDFDDLLHKLNEIEIEVHVISIDLIGPCPLNFDRLSASSEDPAVIICTSGTTGKPKGVMLKHSSLCNYISNLIRVFELQCTLKQGQDIDVGEYSLCCSSFSFDGSLHEILPILWLGGTLVFHPPNPALSSPLKFLFSTVTFFFSQPIKLSVFNASQFLSLRTLSVGGEAFTLDLLKQWQCKDRSMWNVYGPCETTIGCCLGKLEDNVHLGSPIANVLLRITNPAGVQLPIGVPGELHVSGVGLSLGYTDSSLNNEAFWIDAQGIRWYRTRDLVILDDKLYLHFISRIPQDRQAKVHSVRLELSGIENVLRLVPGVEFAHVHVEEISQRLERLVAYVSPITLDHVKIRNFLVKELPSTSVPALIIPVSYSEVIQVNKAGKSEMINANHRFGVSTPFSPPSNKLEERVLQIFCNVLGISSNYLFGMDNDIGEFGADSAAIMVLSTQLSDVLHCNVLPQMIFSTLTPRRLIELLQLSGRHEWIPVLPQAQVEALGQKQSSFERSQMSSTENMSTRSVSFFQEVLGSMNSRAVGATYNVAFVWQVSGSVDGLQLAFAFEKVLPFLDSAYSDQLNKSSTNHCRPAQMKHIDLSSLLCDQYALQCAIRRVQLDAITPIDYGSCPYRATLYHLGNDIFLISVVAHHMVFDHQTWINIDKAIEHLYHNPDLSTFTGLNTDSYSAYIAHEEHSYIKMKSECLEFWKSCLEECTPFVHFPTSYMRLKPISFYGNVYSSALPVDICHQVNEVCAVFSIWPAFLFLAVYSIMIHNLSNCSKFAIGVTMNQRTPKRLEDIIGMMITVLPCSFPESIFKSNFYELICHVGDWFWSASKYSSVPCLEVMKMWNKEHTDCHLPQFIYNFVPDSLSSVLNLGPSVSTKKIDVQTYTSKAEILLSVYLTSSKSYSCVWEYNSSLFSGDDIKRIANAYESVLSSGLRDLCICVERISMPKLNICAIDNQHHVLSKNTILPKPMSRHQRTIFKASLYSSIEKGAIFHSMLSVQFRSCDMSQATQIVAATLQKFPDLMQVVSISENNEEQLVSKNDFTFSLTAESVYSESEAFGVEQRILTWPFNLIASPLFRCALIRHCFCKMTKLVLVVHQVIVGEETLHLISNHMRKISSDMSVWMVDMNEPKSAVLRHISSAPAYTAKNVVSSFMSCSKVPVSLNVTDSDSFVDIHYSSLLELQEPFTFQYDYDFIDEGIAYFCVFIGLFLSKIQGSRHVHFALYCPCFEENVSEDRDFIIPICFDVDDNKTFSEMVTSMRCIIADVYSQTSDLNYSYWAMQEEVNPFSTYMNPFHDVLVKIIPSSNPSVSVQYIQPFKVSFTFNIAVKEVMMTSSLVAQQAATLRKYFKSYLQTFSDCTNDLLTVSLFPHASTHGKELSPVQDSDLQKLISFACEENRYSIAVCEIAERECCPCFYTYHDNAEEGFCPCFYTYHEVERLSTALLTEIRRLASDDGLVVIMVSKGVMLPICLIACCLGKYSFTVIDIKENQTVTRDKLMNVPVSLILFDVSSISYLEQTLLTLFPYPVYCLIVEPYLNYQQQEKTSSLLLVPSTNSTKIVASSQNSSLNEDAFFVFTSGSTGKSKPTPVLRESLVVFLEWFKQCSVSNDQLRWLQFISFSFDVFIAETLTQFLCGSMLILYNPDKRLEFSTTSNLMALFSIEAIHVVPTVLEMMLKTRKFTNVKLPHLKHVFSAGECLPPGMCSEFFQNFPPCKNVILHNWGGPSECCIGMAHAIINSEPCLSVVPCGYPVTNCEIQIVNVDSFQPVPKGFPGEIIVSGTCVFNGYYGIQDNISLKVFNEKLWYRTGDIGYIEARDQLVILKRIDSQVKLSGQRVDLRGIKSLIIDLNLPYLIDVILEVVNINGRNQLVCFPLVTDNVKITEEVIQKDLSTQLQSKFVPQVLKCMTQYPLLTSQKTNFRELKRIAEETILQTASLVLPETTVDINPTLLQIIHQLNPGVKMFDSHLSLDAFGFNSVMKATLYQELVNNGYRISINSILSSRSLLELSIHLDSLPSLLHSALSHYEERSSSSHENNSTAIIAMYVEVAGASSPEQLWEVICGKSETISHDLLPDPCTTAEMDCLGRNYIGSRGILPNKKLFDASLFGILPDEAKKMDPQQRLLLQAVWIALEQAGYDPEKFNKSGKIGVFAGAQFPSYIFNLIDNNQNKQYLSREDITWGTLRDNTALRIGRILDCRGPCITFANNCATFMVALHHANKSLLSNECDMAVVATATVSAQSSGYLFSERDIYSKDGHCRPFSLSASGTVMSDGITVLVLRRTADAIKEQDSIVCLVKGTSVGSDGAFARDRQLEPSAKGQIKTLEEVFAVSNLRPSHIGLVEAHGSGTKVGDLVELESLSSVFGHIPEMSCPLGSIKGNIGHTGVTAAGPAIVKAALAIQLSKIPPSINCEDPLQNLQTSPFFVNTELTNWTSQPRRALVHSVGALGSNSAVILENFVTKSDRKSQLQNLAQFYPICISANTKNSLRQLACGMANLLDSNSEQNLRDISFSLLYTRRFLFHRATTICASLDELRNWFTNFTSSAADLGVAKVHTNMSTTILFGGQVSFVDATVFTVLSNILPGFEKCVSECFQVLHDHFPNELKEYDSQSILSISPDTLERPQFQHVLHVIAQLAVWKSLCCLGVVGECFVGHSLGEYTAACVTGALPINSVIPIVFQRGLFIESCAPCGCMLSVSLPADEVKKYITSAYNGIEISCHNSQRYSVVSGSPDLVEAFAKVLRSNGIECHKLSISYAYHHSCMARVQEKFSDYLHKNFSAKCLIRQLVTCSKGHCKVYNAGCLLPLSYWSDHLVTTCDFFSASQLLPPENSLFVEIGLKPVLCKFISSPSCVPICLLPHKDVVDAGVSFMKDFTELWKAGAQIQLHKLLIYNDASRCILCCYPFDLQEYWIDPLSNPVDDSSFYIDHPAEVAVEQIMEEIRSFTGSGYEDALPPDSLVCMYLRNRLYSLYKVDVTKLIERNASVLEIAEYVIGVLSQETITDLQLDVLKLLSPTKLVSKPILFIINAVDKTLHSFVPMALALHPYVQVYGVYASTAVLKFNTIEKYADFYLAKIRQIQPSGPLFLGGFSFGAWVAHAIVCKLQSLGEHVTHLLMIDPPVISKSTFPDSLYSLLTLNLEMVCNFTRAPAQEIILEHGYSFELESNLLKKYQYIQKTVTCPVLILLAKDRLASSSFQPSEQFWKSWCSGECLSVRQIPGHHETCFSSLNCSSIVALVLSIVDSSVTVSFELPVIPVPSSHEIKGEWKLQRFFHVATDNTADDVKIDDSFIASSFLRVASNGECTCILPLLPKLVSN